MLIMNHAFFGNRFSILFIVFILLVQTAGGQSNLKVNYTEGGFPLSVNGKSASLLIDDEDYPGVIRACKDLQSDIEKVTRARPRIINEKYPESKNMVIIGTLGKSSIIDWLVSKGKMDISRVKGKWETFIIQVIPAPVPGVKEALVIAGSDKRGTIYGIYELSSAIGVSPWYWWADVNPDSHDALYIDRKVCVQGPPSVKYRGIFLNDEYPNLTRWVTEKYGTVKMSQNPPIHEGIANYNHEFYTRLFELILRLRGNYLWPAMWNNAFNEDDTLNPVLADEYGIVMGTSHQEPMLRAQKEWDRRYLKTLGTWNYAKHPEILQEFWRDGIRRNKNYESIITVGLRGANDTEMAPGGPSANMAMLENIVDVQRKMITEEIHPDITKVPQMWCLYKEVQEYYKEGMRVPEDVTLLWAEDNWGNIRRVPTAEERKRPGGAGIYYHFDYHGGPRSYQWINTSPLSKIWDQMSFAKQYGADRIWIVNVGHFKAYSFPLHYFMDLAWFGGDSLTNANIREYTRNWAINQFGPEYADETARILTQYSRYNGRRKPELLSPKTYSLVNYHEAERVVEAYRKLADSAEVIYKTIAEGKKDAYYQLVLFPVKAGAIVNELYLAAGRNYLYAKQQRANTAQYALETEALFRADTALMNYFNFKFRDGKWMHFMDQPHLGYVAWNDPPVNSLQHLTLKNPEIPDIAKMGVSIEGSEEVWPGSQREAKLPEFDVFNNQKHAVEIFNKGSKSLSIEIIPGETWILTGAYNHESVKDQRIWISIDWEKVTSGRNEGKLRIIGNEDTVEVAVSAFKSQINLSQIKGFVEAEGYVSIEAEHFTGKTDFGENHWLTVEDFGHTLSGMRATAGTDASPCTPLKDAPCLEYGITFFSKGNFEVNLYTAPTLNFQDRKPVRYAIAFDNEEIQTVTLVPADFDARNGNRDWEKTVSDNYRLSLSKHMIQKEGYHTLKIWMVDPGVVLQKIVVDTGGLRPSYLGPPESFRKE